MLQQLQRDSGIPLVYQLSALLKEQIAGGKYGPNDALPTEEALAKRFRISRTTVRLALGKLVNEGLIRREQGRGTFVNPLGLVTGEPKAIARDMYDVKSTSHIIGSAGMKVGTDVRVLRLEQPTADVAEKLELGSAERVFYIERLRRADELPLVLERIWLPERLYPGLSEDDLRHSLYKTLSSKAGITLAAAHQALRATLATEAIAELLGVEAGAPIMSIRGVTFTSEATAVEVEESYFRGDLMEFVVELGSYSRYARLRVPEAEGDLAEMGG